MPDSSLLSYYSLVSVVLLFPLFRFFFLSIFTMAWCYETYSSIKIVCCLGVMLYIVTFYGLINGLLFAAVLIVQKGYWRVCDVVSWTCVCVCAKGQNEGSNGFQTPKSSAIYLSQQMKKTICLSFFFFLPHLSFFFDQVLTSSSSTLYYLYPPPL